jgi:cytochrome c oxidase subunit 2
MKAILFFLDLPPEASTFATGIDALHAFVFGTTIVGSLFVLALAVFFIARYHESRDVPRRRHTGHSSTAWETFVIGTIATLFLLWWAIGFHQFDAMVNPPPDAMVVYVTAKQWMWKFEHPTGEIELGELTVPADTPVVMVMTSRDVINSFYVPAFRGKQDVIPGRYTTAWFDATTPGDYPLRCAELCGAGHSEMLATVHVVARDQFAAALKKWQPRSPSAERGLAAAARLGCLSCHSLDGSVRVGPSWRALSGSVVTMNDGSEAIADDEYLTQSMMDPSARVVVGFADVMPSYAGSLSPADAGDIVSLLHWLAQPDLDDDVTAAPPKSNPPLGASTAAAPHLEQQAGGPTP